MEMGIFAQSSPNFVKPAIILQARRHQNPTNVKGREVKAVEILHFFGALYLNNVLLSLRAHFLEEHNNGIKVDVRNVTIIALLPRNRLDPLDHLEGIKQVTTSKSNIAGLLQETKEQEAKMSGGVKRVADALVKSIDWDKMDKFIISDPTCREFQSLCSIYLEVSSTLKSKTAEVPQPIDWDSYRKTSGAEVVDVYKKVYESYDTNSYVDPTTPKYKPKFDAIHKECQEIENKSLEETPYFEKEIEKPKKMRQDSRP